MACCCCRCRAYRFHSCSCTVDEQSRIKRERETDDTMASANGNGQGHISIFYYFHSILWVQVWRCHKNHKSIIDNNLMRHSPNMSFICLSQFAFQENRIGHVCVCVSNVLRSRKRISNCISSFFRLYVVFLILLCVRCRDFVFRICGCGLCFDSQLFTRIDNSKLESHRFFFLLKRHSKLFASFMKIILRNNRWTSIRKWLPFVRCAVVGG